MCISCYEEYRKENEADFPVPFTKQMRTLANLIDDFYEDWPVGGALHNVLDDWNLGDKDIRWCLENIREDRKDPRVQQIADQLLKLPMAERYEALKKLEVKE